MSKAQKAALAEIISQYQEYVKQLGGHPNETFFNPLSGQQERNGVTVDVRNLKILAGFEVDDAT